MADPRRRAPTYRPIRARRLVSVLAGGILALLVLQLDGGTALAIGASVAAFVLTIVAFLAYARHDMRRGVDVFTPIFPTREPPAEPSTEPPAEPIE